MSVNKDLLLYVEPQNEPSKHPVIDEYTCTMTAAMRKAVAGTANYSSGPPYSFHKGGGYRGWHMCSCGASSDNHDYQLLTGDITNLLSIHYLAYHRDEISEEQLAKVFELGNDVEIPTNDELRVPKSSEGIDIKKVIKDRFQKRDVIHPSEFGDKRWSVGFKDRGLEHGDYGILDENGGLVAEMTSREGDLSNAHLIVSACNNVKELIAMVEKMSDMMSYSFDTKKIRTMAHIRKRLTEIKELIND